VTDGIATKIAERPAKGGRGIDSTVGEKPNTKNFQSKQTNSIPQ
jgi:hypothetical protein